MRTARSGFSLAFLASTLCAPLPAQGASLSFATIDAPGARATSLDGINNAGQTVGVVFDADGREHGFLRSSDGTFTTVDVPGATETVATGINDAGQIVGFFSIGPWLEPDSKVHGFVRAPNGAFTAFDVPGGVGTEAYGISNTGQIVGTYEPNSGNGRRKDPLEDPPCRGFVRTPAGAFTTFDGPHATRTRAQGINSAGQIVGYFRDAGGSYHSFVRTSAGAFTTFDVPGATRTQPAGINKAGQIVGTFDAGGRSSGFVRTSVGAFTTFEAPGATSLGTFASGINDAGQIVGTAHAERGVSHGYVASPTR